MESDLIWTSSSYRLPSLDDGMAMMLADVMMMKLTNQEYVKYAVAVQSMSAVTRTQCALKPAGNSWWV